MQRILKNTIYLILILLPLTGCQSVKDGLTGQKKNNTDEFLVQKKNPLVQPPEFNDLPKPYSKKIDEDGKEDIDLSGVLTKKNTKTKISIENKESNISLEKSIIEKINSN